MACKKIKYADPAKIIKLATRRFVALSLRSCTRELEANVNIHSPSSFNTFRARAHGFLFHEKNWMYIESSFLCSFDSHFSHCFLYTFLYY
jgi:hypothetical protein